MDNEIILNAKDLENKFKDELDVVTLEPYKIGDRVTRCRSCHRVIKTKHISYNSCPYCDASPFVSCPVYPRSSVRSVRPVPPSVSSTFASSPTRPAPVHPPRYTWISEASPTELEEVPEEIEPMSFSDQLLFFGGLLVSSLWSAFPFYFPSLGWGDSLCSFLFDISYGSASTLFISIGILTSLVIVLFNKKTHVFAFGKEGLWLLALPFISPYVLLGAGYLLHLIFTAILYVVLFIIVMVLILGTLSEIC